MQAQTRGHQVRWGLIQSRLVTDNQTIQCKNPNESRRKGNGQNTLGDSQEYKAGLTQR